MSERNTHSGDAASVPIIVSHDVMIPMRDGVRLATDIYRPALPSGEPAPGPFPVILTRTSYDKSNPVMQVKPVGEFFARHGYAVAVQDLRGRGNSEDVGNYHHRANPLEGVDGYDTIEWLAAQRWSNGRVGMVGTSHSASVQNVAALTRPPHLAACWIDSSPTSAFDWEARRGGAMAMQMIPALFVHASDAPEIRDDAAAMARVEWGGMNLRAFLKSMPFKSGQTPLAAAPNLERILFRYTCDGVFNEFWAQETLHYKSRWDQFPDIPVVLSTGWYDLFTEEVTQQFAALAARNKTPQRLVVGPWNHTAMRTGHRNVGEVDFGPDSAWGYRIYNRERLRWFDRWLKDQDTGIEKDPPVRMFVMGGGTGAKLPSGHVDHGGRWRAEQTWPLARALDTPFYLHAGGRLSTDAPTDDDASASWTHDPEKPVPTLGGSVAPFLESAPLPPGMAPEYIIPRARMKVFVVDGAMHQRERPDMYGSTAPYPLLSERSDVLVFQSEPLTTPIEVTGQLRVKLWVSSTALDTDFTAKLLDIAPPTVDYPEGFHMNLVDSVLRARFRNGFDREEFMTPGEACEITIVLPPISNLFATGHRIRLDIASSSFPQFDVNPNTGEPLGRHTHTVRAVNTVHLSPERPSRIVLPIVAS
ncbi:CocE/NonD family hydrolase [Terrarubrum flagellatum]|uniref:CocE/NonD family hydrolase n=1 Tax=Terrirubrum flagellatum TaxID=2895980 RepID=UPI0031453CA4